MINFVSVLFKFTAMARKPRLGSGKRFKNLTKKGISPALAATIGRNKYGAKKFNKLATVGRRRALRKKK